MVVEREEGEEGGKRRKDKGTDGAMCGQWKPREAMQGALRGKQKRSHLDGTRFCGLLRALAGSFRALLLRVSARSSRALAASCGLLRAFAESLRRLLRDFCCFLQGQFFRLSFDLHLLVGLTNRYKTNGFPCFLNFFRHRGRKKFFRLGLARRDEQPNKDPRKKHREMPTRDGRTQLNQHTKKDTHNVTKDKEGHTQLNQNRRGSVFSLAGKKGAKGSGPRVGA